ncbi:LuxR C-terminal-related transcriptional regulator, partial [Actinosynnema sp.]|uniref:response regulator transcription factor n=1 Tax=Actinosynnema sp. TaxID=1872144 RepID=UPI003F857010
LTRPDPPAVLVLTTFDSDEPVLGALPARIAEAVWTAAAGEPVLLPQAVVRLIAAATGPGSGEARRGVRERLAGLTERELEVARGIAEGLGNAEIAARLGIGVATVKAHTGNLFGELGVDNRVRIALLVRDAEG